MAPRYRWFVAGLATVLAYFQFGTGLHRKAVRRWDEQIYYNVAQNVLDGHWLLPQFTLESHPLTVPTPFLHKPPLAYWLQAGAMSAFGVSPASARLPSLLAAAGTVGVAVLLAIRLRGPPAGGFTAAVLLLSPAYLMTHGATDIGTDALLVFFGIASIYALVVAVETSAARWQLLAGGLFGLATLSKGIAAAPFALFALPFVVRHRDDLGWAGVGRVVGAGTLVVVPWFAAVAALAPEELLGQMFLQQVADRATGARFVAYDSTTFEFMHYPYLREAPSYLGVAWTLLPVAATVSVVESVLTRRLDDVDVLCWPLLLGTVGLYAATGNHLWYLLPVVVPGAVLVGRAASAIVTAVADAVVTYAALRREDADV
ncbi:ArnT family glycosyltransferase [Halopelagius fulvigenes]|uniref:ArnT family glycosyltransferase n=1 Tax=Halopelagius fulvigenes TaxID=1198324 RepID=A0ABD5TWX7_9EURY